MLALSVPGGDATAFQHDWIVFNQRRFEALELRGSQMARDLLRQREFGSKLAEELAAARDHLKKHREDQAQQQDGKDSAFQSEAKY